MLEPIKNFYERSDEENRLVSRHGQVEFLTTMRYIEKYLRPNMRIIEIGAGTGRYSLSLAKLGYAVDAIELIEHNIEIFKNKIKPGEAITVKQGDAINLSFISDNTYDITLLLGPITNISNGIEHFISHE